MRFRTTARTRFMGGIPVVIPNRTDEVPTGSTHWHISYNDHDIRDYGSPTTALVLGSSEYFLILNGDHREELRERIQLANNDLSKSTLSHCLDYVREHRERLNTFSDPLI